MKSASISWPVFSSVWWGLPQQSRFLSLIALRAGISVQIEPTHRAFDNQTNDPVLPLMIWRGSYEQFVATGLFKPEKFPTVKRSRWTRVQAVLGTLFRPSENELVYRVEHCNGFTNQRMGKYAAAAREDQLFLNFREAVMSGFPLADVRSES